MVKFILALMIVMASSLLLLPSCIVGFLPNYYGRSNVKSHNKLYDSETLESLSDALSRRVLVEHDDDSSFAASLQLLRTRLADLDLNAVRVAPSPQHGHGLFATRDCQKGDLLTCYPGDVLLMTNHDEWKLEWGDHVDPNDRIADLQHDKHLLGYILYVNEEYSVLGLPNYKDHPAYLGHFANDGGTMPTCEEELSAYVLESNKRQNAMHQGISADCHMVTVATANIKTGDEIFVTYGPDYWRERDSFDDKKHKTTKTRSTGTGFG